MDFLRRFAVLAWLAAALVILVLVVAAFFLLRSKHPSIPPGLVEKRQAVSDILKQSNGTEDVDIRPLVDLEAKKNYGGAVALMERAISENQVHHDLASSLVGVAGELSRLAVQVKPDDVGAKAVGAFSLLTKFAEANRTFYEDRGELYHMTRDYYAGLAAKKSPAIPDTLRHIVDTVTKDRAAASTLNQQFASAIKAFDAMVGKK